jgi:hypothetical protein
MGRVAQELYAQWDMLLREKKVPPVSKKGLITSPWVVFVPKKEAQALIRFVRNLLPHLRRIMKQYGRGCWEGTSDLVRLLESGVPGEWLPIIRVTRADLSHIVLDFQSGKLIEINSRPPAPFSVGLRQMQVESLVRELGAEPCQVPLTSDFFAEWVFGHWVRKVRKLKGVSSVRVALPTKLVNLKEVGAKLQRRYGCAVSFYQPGDEVRIARNDLADILWVTIYSDEYVQDLSRAATERGLIILPSRRHLLLSSKRFLAALSSPAERKILGISPKAWLKLRSGVLWARSLETEDVLENVLFMLSRGVDVVAKEFARISCGGRGVDVLRRANRDVLRRHLGASIVQEFSGPYEISGTLLRYDLRVYVYGDEILLGARVFGGNMMNMQDPEAGGAPVFVF